MFYLEKILLFKTSDQILERALYYSALVIWRAATVPYKLAFNPDYRSLMWLKYFKPDDVHQLSNYTAYNRYPALFSACKDTIAGQKELTILSYGCSTGEEVFTLRSYFPSARIIGVDINKNNIKTAQRNNADADIIFSHSIGTALSDYGPFDIIFALAVFQKTENRDPNTFDSSSIYPFKKFNAKITELDTFLKTNGIFVIDNADYLFEECDIYPSYHPLIEEKRIVRDRYMFTRENRRMAEYCSYNRMFIKKSSTVYSNTPLQ